MHIRGLIFVGMLAALPGAAGAATFVRGGSPAESTGFTVAQAAQPGGAQTLRQRFETVAGQSYIVDVAPRAGANGASNVRTVLTTATGGVIQTSTFDAVGQSSGALGWRTYAYSFVTGDTATTMTFASADTGAPAAALAPVSVAELPEPAIWAMMLFGFFGLSFAVRRRDMGPKARVRFS